MELVIQFIMKFVNSTNFMYLLLSEYTVLFLLCAWERNWGRCIYFIGAVVINIGVLMMAPKS